MNGQYAGIERRGFERVPVTFIVFYRVNSPLLVRLQVKDKEIEALMFDLSEGGMGVLTHYQIPTLTKVTSRFMMFNDRISATEDRSRFIASEGEVRYSIHMNEEGLFRFGVKFIDLSTDDRSFIVDFINANKLNNLKSKHLPGLIRTLKEKSNG